MNFMDTIRNIVKKLFGVDPVTTQAAVNVMEQSEREYRRLDTYNITAIFAARLASFTVSESSVEVLGDNQRAALIGDVVGRTWKKSKKFASKAYGTGGVLLIPYVTGRKIYVDIVPQSSMIINRVNGDDLRAVSIIADSTVQADERYFRWTDYDLDDNGLLTIRQRATNAIGSEVPLQSLSEWAGISEEMTIANLESLPFAYLKNPTDNRINDGNYGVPVTYGCDVKIREIVECMEEIRREYRLKKPIVGMDQTLFGVKNGRRYLPVTGLFMPVTPSGLNNAGKLWEVYDPAIRDSSYYNRLNHLCEELEKQVGTSRGILTEPATHGATATEIKAANQDTYAIITDMRTAIEDALRQLAYAVNVLANAYSLSPMGDYELTFDWSYALIESSQETYNQLLASVTVDAVEAAELRQFSFPAESLEEARERVAEIKKNKADLSDLLMKQALAEEAKRNPENDEDREDEE